MKKLAIFLTVLLLMIGIFLLTRGSIPAEQTSLVWALIGTALLIAAFFVIRRQKPK
jgi:predicted tellurium resistance membrane protein TerC